MISNYVLLTPAHNEEAYIERTVLSVISQTLKPVIWVIIDDGSTDQTAAIVSRYLSDHAFIRLLRLAPCKQRSFAKKAAAFAAGCRMIEDVTYSFIGNVDADITLPPQYYAGMIQELQKDPTLGICGGIVYERRGQTFVTDDITLDSVGGAVQLFRRECFQQIGGYRPLQYGGIDAAAEILARMNGWRVRKFPEYIARENRPTSSVGNSVVKAKFREGIRFHSLGYSAVFYTLRSVRKIAARPYVIGTLIAMAGFVYARMRRLPMSLPQDVISYLRSEQISRLRQSAVAAVFWVRRSEREVV